MKKFLKISLLLSLLLVVVISTVSFATQDEEFNLAHEVDFTPVKGEEETLASVLEEENANILDNDLFMINDSVVVNQDVIEGNLYIIADSAEISCPKINGDIFIISNNCTISGNVNGSIFAIANQITFSGTVNDIYTIASNIITDQEFTAVRDVKVIAENMVLKGNVRRDFLGIVEILDLGKDEVVINRNFTCSAKNLLGSAVIDGENNFTKIEEKEKDNAREKETIANKVNSIIASIVLSALTVWIVILKMVKSNKKITEIRNNYFSSFFMGIFSLIGLVVLGVICIFVPYGITIGLFALFYTIYVLFYFSTSQISADICKSILKYGENDSVKLYNFYLASLALNTLFIIMARTLPAWGFLIVMLFSICGFGNIVTKTLDFLLLKKEVEKGNIVE